MLQNILSKNKIFYYDYDGSNYVALYLIKNVIYDCLTQIPKCLINIIMDYTRTIIIRSYKKEPCSKCGSPTICLSITTKSIKLRHDIRKSHQQCCVLSWNWINSISLIDITYTQIEKFSILILKLDLIKYKYVSYNKPFFPMLCETMQLKKNDFIEFYKNVEFNGLTLLTENKINRKTYDKQNIDPQDFYKYSFIITEDKKLFEDNCNEFISKLKPSSIKLIEQNEKKQITDYLIENIKLDDLVFFISTTHTSDIAAIINKNDYFNLINDLKTTKYLFQQISKEK